MFERRSSFGPLVLVASLVWGCDDSAQVAEPWPTLAHSNPGEQTNEVLPRFPELIDHVPAVEIGILQRAFDTDDALLVQAVADAAGVVHIGLKSPDAPPISVSGVIPAMSKAEALSARARVEAAGAQLVRTFRNSATVVAVIDPTRAPELKKLPTVSYIEPTVMGHLARSALRATSSTATVATSPQDTTWGVFKVRAPQAWAEFFRGGGAYITILDSGVDSTHVWDPNGDVLKVDFSCLFSEGVATSCYDDLGPPINIQGHGTLVYSVAMSRNNDHHFLGIAHGVRGSASVKVCDRLGQCPPEDVAGGLDWTITNGEPRQIVNMSIAIEDHNLLREFVIGSWNAGNLLVAAIGNNDSPPDRRFPARYGEVIAVSGTLEDDSFAAEGFVCPIDPGPDEEGWSNTDGAVELSAPFWAWGMALDGDVQSNCGTSFAAPVVSAVAALIWNKNQSWTRIKFAQSFSNQCSITDRLGATPRSVTVGLTLVSRLTGRAVRYHFQFLSPAQRRSSRERCAHGRRSGAAGLSPTATSGAAC